MSDDFRAGARAMFDALLSRAANNYHGNPKVNDICQKENDLVRSWVVDALEEVSPDDHSEWITITELYLQNRELRRKLYDKPSLVNRLISWYKKDVE